MKTKQNEETTEETTEESEEETEEEATEESEEETEEEAEKEITDKIEKNINKIVAKALKNIKDNPVSKSKEYKSEDLEKSVVETDPYLRSKRPFVKLSKSMERFVDDMKAMAKGGVVKTLTEGDDTAGGYLVPTEFQAEVIRYASENSIIRPRARVYNMTRDSLEIPKLDQSTYQFGGATLYWTAESGEKTASQPSFGKLKLTAKKLIGLCPVSDELLEDSAINLANFLVSLFGEAIGYEEDYRFLRGTGVGQPLGIINTSGVVSVDRNTSSQIRLVDLSAMEAQLPAWADSGSVWVTTKAGRAQMVRAGSETTGGVSLWVPSVQQGMPALFMGKPVIVTDKLPALGTKGDIILCNPSYYVVGDKGGIQVASSIHDRFRYDETTFRFVKRVDGQPAIPTAFVCLGR